MENKKTLQELYYEYTRPPIDNNQRNSDIWALLHVLLNYSRGCSRITEFGTRHGVSTTAFLMALPDSLECYDLAKSPAIEELERLADENGVYFKHHTADVLKIDIEPTDFLFIDTWHIAGQCAAELERHADKVRHRIAFHDVADYAYWERGEDNHYKATGDFDTRGLRYAIEPFMEKNKQWKQVFRTEECNGLLIIERTP